MQARCTQAVLPVAGIESRFLPWTKIVPKELLPIGNHPVIALLIDECLSVGISDICLIIGDGKEAIPRYFNPMPALERELERRGKASMLSDLARYRNVRFHVLHQDTPLGDGHAVALAADWVRSTDVVAVLSGGDLISAEDNGLQQLLSSYMELSSTSDACLLALSEAARGANATDELVRVEHGKARRARKVVGPVLAPPPLRESGILAYAGRALVPSSFFGALRAVASSVVPGTDHTFIRTLLSACGSTEVYGRVLDGVRFDVGTPLGYKQAVAVLA